MEISASELSGLIESDVKFPDWMSKLAEQEKEAMRDDLDQIANSEELSENDLFDGIDHQYLNENKMFESPEMRMQYWSPEKTYIEHPEQEYDNSMCLNNFYTNNINDEIENTIQDILKTPERPALSVVKTMLANKFNQRIATRFIKSNFHRLAAIFQDDLQLEPTANRITDVEIHDNYHLANNSRETIIGSDDVVKEANTVFTSHTADSLKSYLITKFGQKLFDQAFSNYKAYYSKQACTTLDKIDAEFKTLTAQKIAKTQAVKTLSEKYGNFVNEYEKSNNLDRIASFITKGTGTLKRENDRNEVRVAEQKKKSSSFQDKVMFDTIDIVAKQLLISKKTAEVWSQLEKQFGEKMSCYSKDHFNKLSSFVNRNEKAANATREEVVDNTNLLKNRTSKTDTYPIVREAYLRLMGRESLKTAKQNLMNKYGQKTVESAMVKEEANLKEAEHKLGYFYADANWFKDCNKMVDFFSKRLRYAFLLKEKTACVGCNCNAGNICKKTSLVLSENPLKISKKDGARIINALLDIKMVSAEFANGYMSQLADVDNTPVIKAFLDAAKQNVTVKVAKTDIRETQHNEMRSFFSDVNDINVNSLSRTPEEFNLTIANIM